MDKVSKNMSDLERKLTKANKIVAKGDKLGYGDAIKLGRKSNSMVSTINKGIKEYDGTNPTDAESKKILGQMKTIVALTEEQLNGLVNNKAQFEKLKVAGLVKRNMHKTEEASNALSKIMLEKTPASLKDEADALEKRREEVFKKGNAAFEGATGGEDAAEANGDDDSD